VGSHDIIGIIIVAHTKVGSHDIIGIIIVAHTKVGSHDIIDIIPAWKWDAILGST
jgi:hypothetical protein